MDDLNFLYDAISKGIPKADELKNLEQMTDSDMKKLKKELIIKIKEYKKQLLIQKLQRYRAFSENNKSKIKNSVKCVCYGCVSTILTYHISYDENTAVCPYCGRKTVIPYFDDIDYYLRTMHDYFNPEFPVDEENNDFWY